MSTPEEFKFAYNKASKSSKESFLNWTRTVISIITPSLVLLIGLQDKSQQLTMCARYFLVASIVLMSLTVLAGLLLLYSESRGLHLLRDSIADQNNKQGSLDHVKINLPYFYVLVLKTFSFLTPLSIMSLSVFGVLKYVT